MNLLAFALTLLYWVEAQPEAPLAHAAMKHWAAASEGKLELKATDQEDEADIRFRWLNPQYRGLYGTSVPKMVRGKLVHELVINATMANAETDPLLQATILFLTCVHESGHALGLQHTREFADIMYSFEYGGDLQEYFARYRRLLKAKGDVARHSPIAKGDAAQLRGILDRRTRSGKRSDGAAPVPPE
jgi:predicted Zn-dependent protease